MQDDSRYSERVERFIRAIDAIADVLAPEGRPDAPDVSVRELQALRILHCGASVDADGAFNLLVPGQLLWRAGQEPVMVAVFYHGTIRFAPCRSAEVPLRT